MTTQEIYDAFLKSPEGQAVWSVYEQTDDDVDRIWDALCEWAGQLSQEEKDELYEMVHAGVF